jgi:hypothetical protein
MPQNTGGEIGFAHLLQEVRQLGDVERRLAGEAHG